MCLCQCVVHRRLRWTTYMSISIQMFRIRSDAWSLVKLMSHVQQICHVASSFQPVCKLKSQYSTSSVALADESDTIVVMVMLEKKAKQIHKSINLRPTFPSPEMGLKMYSQPIHSVTATRVHIESPCSSSFHRFKQFFSRMS